VLGVDEWSKTFQRGIVHYHFVEINQRVWVASQTLLRKRLLGSSQPKNQSKPTRGLVGVMPRRRSRRLSN